MILFQVCMKASKNNKWYIDSGCSRHMTGDAEKFLKLYHKKWVKVSFRGNQSKKIAKIGEVGSKGVKVEDVYYMEGLCHNLFSVSQTADKDNYIIFYSEECILVSKQDLPINKDSLKTKLHTPRDDNCIQFLLIQIHLKIIF